MKLSYFYEERNQTMFFTLTRRQIESALEVLKPIAEGKEPVPQRGLCCVLAWEHQDIIKYTSQQDWAFYSGNCHYPIKPKAGFLHNPNAAYDRALWNKGYFIGSGIKERRLNLAKHSVKVLEKLLESEQ